MKFANKIFFCISLLLLTSCGSTSVKEEFDSLSESEMVKIASEYMNDGSYYLAAEFYSKLNKIYPYSKNNELNRVNAIYCDVMSTDYATAISEAGYFQKLHPHSKYIQWVSFIDAYAEFKLNRKWIQEYIGSDRAMNDVSNLETAYKKAGRLVSRYPKSKYAPAAVELQHKINAILAKEYYDVSEFYYSREAYVASANRAANIISRFPHSCEVPKAIKILKDSYAKLGLTSWADDMAKLEKINNFK